MEEFKKLLQALKADPRFPGFQSLIVNMDLSMLAVYRYGSLYFKSPDDLNAFLADLPKGDNEKAT